MLMKVSNKFIMVLINSLIILIYFIVILRSEDNKKSIKVLSILFALSLLFSSFSTYCSLFFFSNLCEQTRIFNVLP